MSTASPPASRRNDETQALPVVPPHGRAERLLARPVARRALITTVITLVVAVVATATVVLTAGEVPRGTTVLGVDIGGRTKSEAVTVLRAELGSRLSAKVEFKVGDQAVKLDPAEAGLVFDIKATVDQAADQTVNPLRVAFGEHSIEPVIRVDAAKLTAGIAPQVGEEFRDIERPAIRFEGADAQLHPVAVYGKPGIGLDPATTTDIVREKWLRQDIITLTPTEIRPADSDADVDALIRSLAQPAIAAPVMVQTPEGEVVVSPQAIATGLTLQSNVAGKIVPKIDVEKLREALTDEIAKFGDPATDAKISIVDGKPVVTPSQPGRGLDVEVLAKPLLDALPKAAPRVVDGVMGELQPKLTTEKANGLGVKEQISSFTTNFDGGQDRNKNIILVADEVDGALVMPGQEFSLNGYTGERGPAQGYVKAPVIVGGKIKNEYGGGISQFATTLYNAIFFSGLEDTFHRAHGYYISRYPAGREATVYYPTLDLKFRNDSEHGVLIDASYTDTSITVTFWSTKRYDIESVSEERTNHRPIETTYLENETDCVATEGIEGFDIVVWRIFRQNGAEVKRERVFTKYDAEPKFICGKDPNSPN